MLGLVHRLQNGREEDAGFGTRRPALDFWQVSLFRNP